MTQLSRMSSSAMPSLSTVDIAQYIHGDPTKALERCYKSGKAYSGHGHGAIFEPPNASARVTDGKSDGKMMLGCGYR